MVFGNMPFIDVLDQGGYPSPVTSAKAIRDGRTIGGYSTQAPSGMTDIALQATRMRMDELIARLK